MTIEERARERAEAYANSDAIGPKKPWRVAVAKRAHVAGYLQGAADTAKWVPVEESEDTDEWKSFEFYSPDYSLCLMVRVPPLPGEEG